MRVSGKNVFKEINIDKIKKIYLAKNFRDNKIFNYIKENNLKYTLTDNNILDKMSKNHQGIIVDMHDYDYGKIEDIKNDKLVLILDHLQDPHNFGAIIRSCEARGIKNIIIPKDRSVNVTDTVMKISSGAINHVNIIMVNNIVQTIDTLKKKGFFVYAADMDGKDYKEISYSDKICLIIGNEGSGLSRLVKENSDVIIKISMKGKINSLNASVAAGILLFGIGE